MTRTAPNTGRSKAVEVSLVILCTALVAWNVFLQLKCERYGKFLNDTKWTASEALSILDNMSLKRFAHLYDELPTYQRFGHVVVDYLALADGSASSAGLGRAFRASTNNLSVQYAIADMWARQQDKEGLEHIRQYIDANVAAGRLPAYGLLQSLLGYRTPETRKTLGRVLELYNRHGSATPEDEVFRRSGRRREIEELLRKVLPTTSSVTGRIGVADSPELAP